MQPVEITVNWGKGLKRVYYLSKMDVYVVVSLSGGPTEAHKKTHVDKNCGTDPIWNSPMSFHVDERHSLTFRVICHRRFHSDKDIGQVAVRVSELFNNGRLLEEQATYHLKSSAGELAGELNLSYKLTAEPAAVAVPGGSRAAASSRIWG